VGEPTLSVIIPAFNEERFLPETLAHLRAAEREAAEEHGARVEIIVVDNASNDRTAEVAREWGATVVSVPEHNIARVRNAGALAAAGDVFVFVDADTLVPETVLSRIVLAMKDPDCLGGAVDTDYRPARRLIRVYLHLWRWIGILTGMAQGATQFCRRDAFSALNGYDERMYMGEDVDFYWRLGRLARSRGHRVRLLREIQVVPSCRRFDQWPLVRTLIQTNPLYVTFFCRRPSAWRGWYGNVPR
jgi:glycosyltransferase involved in cell wall biosynthesis